MNIIRLIIILPGLLLSFIPALSREKPDKADSFIVTKNINVQGNERTKRHIILRELDFKPGDTLYFEDFQELIRKNENQVFNTGLFLSVDIEYQRLPGNYLNLIVTVKERWYTFPYPILELADRNFNEWWNQRNHELNRLEYGIRFKQKNVRGRNEEIKLVLQHGFTRKYEGFYKIPYINRGNTIGVEAGVSYSTNKEVAYGAPGNVLTYIESEEVLRERFYAKFDLFRRKNIHKTHYIENRLNINHVGDSVLKYSPRYFQKGEKDQRYFSVKYRFVDDHRNRVNYPLKGYYFEFSFTKLGVGLYDDLDIFFLSSSVSKYLKLEKNLFFSSEVQGKYSIYGFQPFFNIEGLGYSQKFVRGFEYYVINGQHFLLNKNSLNYRILRKKFGALNFIPIKKFREIPLDVYVKVFADQGYVWDNDNLFYNKFGNSYIAGGGVGLDFVTYYDIVIRVEYSFTNYFEKGIFFHFEKSI